MYQQYKPRLFTTAVLNLIIINGILFLATSVIAYRYGLSLEMKFALYYPTFPEFRWYQIITHMFMHGSFMHIFLNMFGLWQLGTSLENLWGTKRFLFFYFFCGVGAFLMHWIMCYFGFAGYSPIIGASGAITGLLAAFAILFPNTEFLIMFIPIPIKAKYLGILFIVYELIMGLYGNDGIAHFAHIGGMIAGAILILYWKKFNRNTLY